MAGSRWPASWSRCNNSSPLHSGQVGIDQEAGFAAWMIGFEERLATRVILDGLAIFLEHGANRVAYVAVVVDDEDDGRLRTACGRFGWVRNVSADAARIAISEGDVG